MDESKNQHTIVIPKELPILVLENNILFPNLIMPYLVDLDSNIRLVNDALVGSKIIGVFSQKNVKDPGIEREPFEVGTAAAILKFFKMPDGSIRIIIQGIKRIKIENYTQNEPYLKANIDIIDENYKSTMKLEALHRNIVDNFRKIGSLAKDFPDEIISAVLNIKEPNILADFISSNMEMKLEDRQRILKEVDLEKRLLSLSEIISREIELLEIDNKIRTEISTEIDKTQRQYYLREQLKAIRKELGEGEDQPVEVKEFEEKINKSKMPKETRTVAEKELNRLKNMNPASAEYSVSVNYLDWLTGMPWKTSTVDRVEIKNAKKILDEDHYALDDIKDRILEFLSIRKLNKKLKGPILCFIGPPGVGKTSLGRSIARALGRKFLRISLGGMRDEAEIRGHRRTYVSALPGRIIQGIKKAKVNNPVFMLDEVDKLGSDFRGDPSSALLEVLDPEQNFSFSDHYLDVAFDLSNVMFIATANDLFPIPAPLRDRMEILTLPGYITEDKIKIAQRYLISRQIAANGLRNSNITFTKTAIQEIITMYTREAGVRNLERKIGTVCRKVARQFASGHKKPEKIFKNKVKKFLGPPRFFSEIANRDDEIGVATGLAWTVVGGEVLFIESVMMQGNRGFILTGQLGNVMKESARAALSYLRSRSADLKIDKKLFANNDIHIHIPAGATPKDGPSAGITIATSLASLFTKRPVKHDIAMTGEITLRGKVMPVGGIREKIIAAKRAGIKSIIIPKRNVNDLESIPDNIRKSLNFYPVDTVDEVWDIALNNGKK